MSEENAKKDCPIAVILDANIYYNDPALRHADALALLYHLSKSGGKLALPEITRLEVEANIHESGSLYADAIRKGLDYFGRLQNRKLESPQAPPTEWVVGFDKRVQEINPIVLSISEQHLRSALKRVIAKTAPNGPKNQQFKDSLLWEAAIELSEKYHVMLIAFDNHFRESKEDNKLAPNLAEEVRNTHCGLQIYRNVPACLEALKVRSAPVDEAESIPILDNSIRSVVNPNAAQLGFALDNLSSRKLKFYALAERNLLSVTFDLHYAATDLWNELGARREEVMASIQGVCFYNEKEKLVSGIELDRIFFEWRNVDGTPGQGGFVFGRTVSNAPLWKGPLSSSLA